MAARVRLRGDAEHRALALFATFFTAGYPTLIVAIGDELAEPGSRAVDRESARVPAGPT